MWHSAVEVCCMPWMPRGFGRFRPWMRAYRPSREELIRWLEEYQRDLEQELADVAEELRRLRGEGQPA